MCDRREGMTVTGHTIELLMRPEFPPGMVVQYENDRAVVVEDKGDFIDLAVTRQHVLRDGHKLVPDDCRMLASKSQVVEENAEDLCGFLTDIETASRTVADRPRTTKILNR
jgi:hypothetical protein